MTKQKIIILDDEAGQRTVLETAFRSVGYEVTSYASPLEALERLRFDQVDLLITDLRMPQMDGLKVLEMARALDSTVSVIMMSGMGTIEVAVQAMKLGADDFVQKPIELAELEERVKKLFAKRELQIQHKRLQSENAALNSELRIRFQLANVFGKSASAISLFDSIKKNMKHRQSVLLLGEPGSSRQEIAQMIHYNSPWGNQPFLNYDCSQMSDDLHEVMIFGQAPQMAESGRLPPTAGLAERAHLGTLYISNIHKMGKGAQARLVRLIKEEKVQRLGTHTFTNANVRIIASANMVPLTERLNSGDFRVDLSEILKANQIQVDPLRKRKEDISILVAATVKRFSRFYDKPIDRVESNFLDAFSAYDFPGNMRELESLVETAIIRCQSNSLKLSDVPHLDFGSVKV